MAVMAHNTCETLPPSTNNNTWGGGGHGREGRASMARRMCVPRPSTTTLGATLLLLGNRLETHLEPSPPPHRLTLNGCLLVPRLERGRILWSLRQLSKGSIYLYVRTFGVSSSVLEGEAGGGLLHKTAVETAVLATP